MSNQDPRLPSRGSSERNLPSSRVSTSATANIRKCEVPWHLSNELGPFYLLTEPEDGPIRTLCKATAVKDVGIIRFKPSYIDFSASNYTNRTLIQVWKCVSDHKIPSFSCGTTSRGAPLVDETYHPRSRHHPGPESNNNKKSSNNESFAHRPKIKEPKVRVSNLRKEDTVLSFTALVVFLVTAWWLLCDKNKRNDSSKQISKLRKRKQQQERPVKMRSPRKQRILDSKRSKQRKKEKKVKSTKYFSAIHSYPSKSIEASRAFVDFEDEVDGESTVVSNDESNLSEIESNEVSQKYNINEDLSPIKLIRDRAESNDWTKIRSKRSGSPSSSRAANSDTVNFHKKNAKTTKAISTNAKIQMTKAPLEPQKRTSSSSPSCQMVSKSNDSLGNEDKSQMTTAAISTNAKIERIKTPSELQQRTRFSSPHETIPNLSDFFDSGDERTTATATTSATIQTMKPPPGLQQRPISLSPHQMICDATEQQNLGDTIMVAADQHQLQMPIQEDSFDTNMLTPNIVATKKVTLLIDGMMCGGCAASASNALEQLNGVESASVNLSLGTSTLRCSSVLLNLQALAEALDKIGLKAYLDLNLVDNNTTTNTLDTKSSLGPIEPPKPLKKQNPLILLDQLRLGGDGGNYRNSNDTLF